MDFRVHKYIYLCKWEYAEILHVAWKIDLTDDRPTPEPKLRLYNESEREREKAEQSAREKKKLRGE